MLGCLARLHQSRAHARPERTSTAPESRGEAPAESATRGKGKHRGHAPRRTTQDCPHCWHPVVVTPRGAGLSQHMWWNVECIACQIYAQGDTTWTQAQHQAQAVKDRREREWNDEWTEPVKAPMEAVVPAASAKHRDMLEEWYRQEAEAEGEQPNAEAEEKEDKEETKEKDKKKKRKRKHRRGGEGSPEVDRDPRPSHVPHYVVRGSLAICTSKISGPK